MSSHAVYMLGFSISFVIALANSAFGLAADAVIWGLATCAWGSLWLRERS